jgi:hypothetical protein
MRVQSNTVCGEPECDKPVFSRGMCGLHYGRAYRAGSLLVRAKPRYAPEQRICPQCQQSFTVRATLAQTYCSLTCGNRAVNYRRGEYRPDVACPQCGKVFHPRKDGAKRCCSKSCAVAWEQFNGRCGIARNLAGKRIHNLHQQRNPLRRAVFERDGWVCRLCGKKVDRSLSWPDPFAASLDHVVPLVWGGTNEFTNLQLTHLRCNLRKRKT